MSPRALLGIGFAAGLIIALVCGQAHVLPLWSLLLVATGCMGAARPRGAMPMAVVVEIGVVIGFILRVMAFAQFVGDPGNLWPVVLLFSVLYSAPVVLGRHHRGRGSVVARSDSPAQRLQ